MADMLWPWPQGHIFWPWSLDSLRLDLDFVSPALNLLVLRDKNFLKPGYTSNYIWKAIQRYDHYWATVHLQILHKLLYLFNRRSLKWKQFLLLMILAFVLRLLTLLT